MIFLLRSSNYIPIDLITEEQLKCIILCIYQLLIHILRPHSLLKHRVHIVTFRELVIRTHRLPSTPLHLLIILIYLHQESTCVGLAQALEFRVIVEGSCILALRPIIPWWNRGVAHLALTSCTMLRNWTTTRRST